MVDRDAGSLLLDPKLDRVFGALGNRYRRLVLFMLRERDGRMQASDVMIRGGAGTSRDDQVDVRYVHLPVLEEAGYLEWDRETGDVVAGPNFDEVEPLLELVVDSREEFPPGWP